MYLIMRKCHVIFDRPKTRYVRGNLVWPVILTDVHAAVISSPEMKEAK